MKTKIRIQKTGTGLNDRTSYNHLYFEVLFPRFNDAHSDYLDVACTFSWQQTKGEDLWYGMELTAKGDRVSKFDIAHKLFKYVQAFRQTSEPKEIFTILGGEEYINHQGDFIPLSKVGQNYYKVWQDEKYYTSVIAPTELLAQKELKRRKIPFTTLEFKHVVTGEAVKY
jgi:hypothetical protein